MICSKCKIFSIHLPNFDSYICEFGHVFCRTCSPQPYSHCSICNGRIVRRAELLIEGVPKTIFRQTGTENSNQMSNAEMEMRNMDSDSDETWSRLFDYHDSEVFAENNLGSPDNYWELEGPKQNPTKDHSKTEISKPIPSNIEHKGDYCKDILKPQFKNSSKESMKLEEALRNRDDSKDPYKKKNCGDVSSGFDPMRDYFERMTQIDTIHEYYRRPNPAMATKSSSKVNISGVDNTMSDSSTVIQHLNEFRKATNYVPPSNVSAYQIRDDTSLYKSAIITTSKTKLQSRKGTKTLTPQQPQTLVCSAQKPNVEVLFKDNLKSVHRKVDVGTMMDICMSPSVNTTETPVKELQHEITGSFEVEKPLSIYTAETTIRGEQSLKKGGDNSSLHTLLRERLKSQVYSQFDCSPKKPQNVFMVQGTANEVLPPRSIEVTTIPKVNKLTEAINSEVEKALINLATFPKFQFQGNLRRDEIVKQSKDMLRERLKTEIYSQFEKGSCIPESKINVKENVSNEIQTEEPRKEKITSSAKSLNDMNVPQDTNTFTETNNEIADTVVQTADLGNICKTVGMSTESYPKLNPELNVIVASKESTLKSRGTCSFDDFIHNSFSNEHRTESFGPSNGDNDVVNEIFEQFQKNVYSASSHNDLAKNQPAPLALPEQIVKISNLDTHMRSNDPPVTKATNTGNAPLKEDCVDLTTKKEIKTFGENHLLEDQVNQNLFFFQQYTQRVPTIVKTSEPFAKSMGDDCTNICMKTVVRNLVEDYREEPRNTQLNGSLDMNKFVPYIKEKFPNITLKQLKEIILNLPTDDYDSEQLCELTPRIPPPATFRSDFEKLPIQPDASDKQATERTTTGYQSSEFPTDFSEATLITAWRAYFCPPIDLYTEPLPQFKAISRFDAEISLVDHLPQMAKPAAELKLPRSPIVCPVTTCNKLIFVSEFSKHIKMDHVKIPVETLTPGRCRNLFLDPRSDEYGINKCHILYLVTDKIRDLGSKELKDYLPLLVMATKVSLLQLISPMCRTQSKEVQNSQQNYLMIWLTGLSPQDLPVYFSLTAWHRYSTTPKCHLVHSGQIYSIRNKHDDRSVYNSGNALLLSQNQVRLLTNNWQDMIELQVMVH